MSSLPDNRKIRVNGTKEPIEFKSNQWFGATVRAHKGQVVVSIAGCCWGCSGVICTLKCFKTRMYKNPFMQERIRFSKISLSALPKILVLKIKESILVFKAMGNKAGFPENWVDLFKYFKN